jgi:hypothetical protein
LKCFKSSQQNLRRLWGWIGKRMDSACSDWGYTMHYLGGLIGSGILTCGGRDIARCLRL